MATPQELAAQIQAGQALAATTTPPQPAPVSNTQPVATAAPTAAPEAPQTGATDGYLNLGKGKVVKKTSPQYKALVASGMTDEQIIAKYQEKTAKPQATEQSQTAAPAPVATQAQETPKVDTQATVQPAVLPDFQDNSQQRQDEIINNLNKYQQTNPGMMADRKIFNESFSYEGRSDLQKSILDNWYQNNVEKATQTASMTRKPSTDIATGYVNGIISDSELSNLQQTDPTKYAEVQQKINEQQTAKKYATLLYGEEETAKEPSPADKMLAQINEMLSKTSSVDMYDEYKQSMNSPEVTGLMNEVTNKEGEIKQIDEQINASKSELEAQFKGSGISQGRINAILQDQTQLLQNKRNTLNLEYQTAAQKYNNKLAVIKDTLDAKEKQYTMQMQQEQAAVQKMSFAYGIYSDQQKRQDAMKASDLQFKRDVEMMNEKYEKDFLQAVKVDKLQNGDINSADPYIVEKAIGNNVDQMMKQYDGLITSSRDQLVTRIKEGIKTGKSYGAVLGEITSDIQGKPEYNMWRNAKLGIDSRPTSLGGGLISIPDGKGGYSIMTEDQFKAKSNIPSEQISAITKAIQAERATSGQSQYDNYDIAQACLSEVGKVGGQCGAFVNNIFQSNGGERIFTNTIDAKIAATKSPTNYSPVPVVGGAVVIDNGASYTDVNGKSVNAGHVAIVTGVNPDGSIDYVDSNGRAGKEKVGINKGVPVSSKMYFTKAPGKNSPTAGNATTTSINYDALEFKNDLQSSSFNYATRMIDAEKIFSETESKVANTSTVRGYFQRWDYLPNALKDDAFRQQEQAERNFITAVLRKESGAAISDSEFSNAQKQYFPTPGDDAKTLEQKRNNRLIVTKNLASQSGAKNAQQLYPLIESIKPSQQQQPQAQQASVVPIDYGWNYGGDANSYAGYASTLYNK